MITEELNEKLTRVGPGTPMGELLRRYWHPVGTAAELDAEPVQPVRLLGEDMTLFKTTRGEIGLIGDRCAHRAVSLAYGIPQENGLRCAYHGWTYDTAGHVVDMPFEPAWLPLKIKAYRVQELGGLIFAYLGPEPAPLLPRWDPLVKGIEQRPAIGWTVIPCNYLQVMENSLDQTHVEWLHRWFDTYVLERLERTTPRPAP